MAFLISTIVSLVLTGVTIFLFPSQLGTTKSFLTTFPLYDLLYNILNNNIIIVFLIIGSVMGIIKNIIVFFIDSDEDGIINAFKFLACYATLNRISVIALLVMNFMGNKAEMVSHIAVASSYLVVWALAAYIIILYVLQKTEIGCGSISSLIIFMLTQPILVEIIADYNVILP